MPVGQLIQWIAVGLILVAVVIVIIFKMIRFNRRLHCKDTLVCVIAAMNAKIPATAV